MVFKAGRKIGRQLLKIRVSILILLVACLVIPATSTDLDLANESIVELTSKHCGIQLEANNAKDNEIHTNSEFHNNSPTKDSVIYKRNNDIKILKRVRTQLKLARNHFRNNREVIARLYSDVKVAMKTDFYFEWLPSQSLAWYKKEIKKLDKDTKVLRLLPVLRDSLYNFSATLTKMQKFNETHYISNYTMRKQILGDLSSHLIAVLCEVVTALADLSAWRHSAIPASTRTGIADGPGWDSNPDHTAMLIQDWGVLTIYYRFLKDWLHISRKMIQDQMDPWPVETAGHGSAISRGHRPSPLPCIRHRCRSSKHKRRKSADSVT